MKVPVLKDIKVLEFQEKPAPTLDNGEVLVQVKYCGICGSDVHGYLHGNLISLGTVMGHECSGVIEDVAPGGGHFKRGDRVAIKPIAQCMDCIWCKRGQYSLCKQIFQRSIGITPQNDGAFGEYVRVKYPQQMLYKLPDNVSLREAALIEPLSTSLHGLRKSSFKLDDTVVVIGAGMIGLGLIKLLKLAGAGKIIVLEKSRQKSKLAMEAGADYIFHPENEALTQKISELTGDIGPDIVFECAGASSTFQLSVNLVRNGGQILLLGITEECINIMPAYIVFKEAEVKGILAYYEEFNEIISLLKNKKLQVFDLISDIIPLSKIVNDGFKRLLESNDIVKILVRP